LIRSQVPHELRHATDGPTALAMLRGEGDNTAAYRPDLVLLDLSLPKQNGHEVLSAIRSDQQIAHLPVVILSTSDAEADRASAVQLGVDDYLVKPMDYQQFSQRIQELAVHWWNLVNDAPEE